MSNSFKRMGRLDNPGRTYKQTADVLFFNFLDISAYFLSYVCLIVLSKGEVLKVLLNECYKNTQIIVNMHMVLLILT